MTGITTVPCNCPPLSLLKGITHRYKTHTRTHKNSQHNGLKQKTQKQKIFKVVVCVHVHTCIYHLHFEQVSGGEADCSVGPQGTEVAHTVVQRQARGEGNAYRQGGTWGKSPPHERAINSTWPFFVHICNYW